jgi:ubiquinone/menaquinone biosynthesis C-methylase UbiE
VTREQASGAVKTSGASAAARRPEGHDGWDDYAPFYDWENARTLKRRDLPFWRSVARQVGGRVLELGCGTGRLTVPLATAGVPIIGVDRSAPMLAVARRRAVRTRLAATLRLIRGDIRFLPFADAGRKAAPFAMVLAPYGMLQSLLRERDLAATLTAVYRVLEPGGTLGIELVADLPAWDEYKQRVSLSGWRGREGGARVWLVESVRQDRRRRLTIFDQEFTERRGRTKTVRTFSLAFRTLSVPQMVRRLEKVGFEISALLGDYKGRAWDPRADVWVILARKPLYRSR